MKAEREGTEYIHHYLIDINPPHLDNLSPVYIDPDVTLIDFGQMPMIEISNSKERI